MLNARLLDFLVSNRLLSPHQYAFRRGLSTVDFLVRFTDYVSGCLSKSRICLSTFLDIQKAYDSVWHDALLYKLRRLRVPRLLYQAIKSFLTQRTCSTRVGRATSTRRFLPRGLPQGSPLSCTLWLIMINDVPLDIIPGVCGGAYADDITLLTSAERAGQPLAGPMQRAVDLLI